MALRLTGSDSSATNVVKLEASKETFYPHPSMQLCVEALDACDREVMSNSLRITERIGIAVVKQDGIGGTWKQRCRAQLSPMREGNSFLERWADSPVLVDICNPRAVPQSAMSVKLLVGRENRGGPRGSSSKSWDENCVRAYAFRLVEPSTDFEQSVQCAKFDTNSRVCAAP